MADYDWSLTSPTDSATIGSVPGHIRTAKDQIASRLDKEHETVVDGTGIADCGVEHKEGSAKAYYEASGPTSRPDGSTALAAGDAGRLWVDSDTGVLNYYSGSEWLTVSMSGGIGGSDVALLAGRSGGQAILGGTGSGDALSLGGSSHEDEGPINIVAADTTLVELNSVPIYSLVLGEDADADSNTIANLPAAGGTTGNALGFGNADITSACLSATGKVAQVAQGSATGAGSDQSVDLGFTPDLILAWSKSSLGAGLGLWFWSSLDSTANYRMDTLLAGRITSGLNISVSGTTVTFPNNGTAQYLNSNSYVYYYIAFKFNTSAQNPA